MLDGKKVLFVKICGTGMSSVALNAKNIGAFVYGVDSAFYPPVSDILKENDIPYFEMTQFTEILEKNRPDIIVVGNALSGKSAEADIIRNSDIPYYSMPSFMETFLLPGHTSVVVSGTHGKTTTSSILSEFLTGCNQKTSYFIGGVPLFSGKNAHFEDSGYYVLEGDEYDTAFFDKGPKFLHYMPDISIVTSIEFDHADIYNNLEEIYQNFLKLTKITKKKVAVCIDYETNRRLLSEIPEEKRWTYSISDKTADLYLEKIGREERFTVFRYFVKGKVKGEYLFPLIGNQNLMNLAALLSVKEIEEIEPEETLMNSVLKNIHPIKRRQEYLGKINGGLIYNDFAHHPTAVNLTLSGFADFFAEKKILAVFDPATNSNARNVFESGYKDAFEKADKIAIGKPPKAGSIPENERFSPENSHSNYVKQRFRWIF